MAYDSIDRPRYVVPALGTIYTVLEAYSWPLVRVATGFFFLPHGMQKLFGVWGGDITRTAGALPGKGCTRRCSGPITSAVSSFLGAFA